MKQVLWIGEQQLKIHINEKSKVTVGNMDYENKIFMNEFCGSNYREKSQVALIDALQNCFFAQVIDPGDDQIMMFLSKHEPGESIAEDCVN